MTEPFKATGDFSFLADLKRHEPEGDPCKWCGRPVAEHTARVTCIVSAFGGGGGGPSEPTGSSEPQVIETDWATLKGAGLKVTVGR